jgi:hypothetical protein
VRVGPYQTRSPARTGAEGQLLLTFGVKHRVSAGRALFALTRLGVRERGLRRALSATGTLIQLVSGRWAPTPATQNGRPTRYNLHNALCENIHSLLGTPQQVEDRYAALR